MDTTGKNAKVSENRKMLREERSEKHENLYPSTKPAPAPDKKGAKNKTSRWLIGGASLFIGLYAVLWVAGWASKARYDIVRGDHHFPDIYSVGKNGYEGLVHVCDVLGVEFFTEVIPCEYEKIYFPCLASGEYPGEIEPDEWPICVENGNGKIAIASIYGEFHTGFLYDTVGFEGRDSFFPVFYSDYQQIKGFFIAPALEGGKWRLIDNEGTILTPAIYDYIEPPYNGLKIRAKAGRKWSTLDATELHAVKLSGGYGPDRLDGKYR